MNALEVQRRAPAVSDTRGTIIDVLAGVPVQHIALLRSAAGSVRGNHYHKEGVHYEYLVSGRAEFVTREPGGEPVHRTIEAGDLTFTPAGVHHAMLFLEPSELLVCSLRPRDAAWWAADTVALDPPLIEAREMESAR